MLNKKLKNLNLNNMKKSKKILIVLSTFFLFMNMQNPNYDKPEGLKKTCSLLALTLYDNAIMSEVDVETAFMVSQIAYYECLFH